AAAVQDDQHDRAIWILKGHILQVALLPGVRFDPVGARSNKFAGVGQGGEIHRGRDFGRRNSSIDFDHPTTVTAPAEVRLMILVEGQVPQNYTLRPVPRRFNNEPNLLLEQLTFLPVAAGTLREPEALFREAAVELALRGHALP